MLKPPGRRYHFSGEGTHNALVKPACSKWAPVMVGSSPIWVRLEHPADIGLADTDDTVRARGLDDADDSRPYPAPKVGALTPSRAAV
jgi:hypothetical protein